MYHHSTIKSVFSKLPELFLVTDNEATSKDDFH